jgi:signal transduction histidine kinase
VSYDRIRDWGGPLHLAQDAERLRIACELHDDVSRQLSGLRRAVYWSGSRLSADKGCK